MLDVLVSGCHSVWSSKWVTCADSARAAAAAIMCGERAGWGASERCGTPCAAREGGRAGGCGRAARGAAGHTGCRAAGHLLPSE
eukprot:2740319-Prymnesium_polylepis.2